MVAIMLHPHFRKTEFYPWLWLWTCCLLYSNSDSLGEWVAPVIQYSECFSLTKTFSSTENMFFRTKKVPLERDTSCNPIRNVTVNEKSACRSQFVAVWFNLLLCFYCFCMLPINKCNTNGVEVNTRKCYMYNKQNSGIPISPLAF